MLFYLPLELAEIQLFHAFLRIFNVTDVIEKEWMM